MSDSDKRFEEFTKKILRVPKKEVEQLEATRPRKRKAKAPAPTAEKPKA